MPRLLQRKFVCFYCNRRSAQDRRDGVQQWQCEQCDAVNHLDENGEITDPPTQDFTSARYVQPQTRSLLPEASPPQRSLFCQRCLQNQHMVNQALAEYLPSPEHPQYYEFEKALPGYRKKMEERFPPVCVDCAPAIERQIRATGYAAKSDHLRRVMERKRGAGLGRTRWTWKKIIVALGAVGWSVGLVGHLAWHLLGALPYSQPEDGLVDEDLPRLISSCFVNGALKFQSSSSYDQLLRPFLIYAFSSSLLCVWWNPKMQYKLDGGYGRIVGSVDFYKLQCVALIIRFVGWTLAAKRYPFLQDQQTARALHALSIVIEILLTISSFRSIHIDQRPLVSFRENYEPLIPPQNRHNSATALQQPSRRSPTPPPKYRIDDSFLAKLDPHPQQIAYQPPTPPPEEDYNTEDSMMDWTPQHDFRPATTYHHPQPQPNPIFNDPSPFHGVLPPAPVSWAHRLRNPPNQPTFRKASEKKKETLFPGRKNQRVVSDAASDVTNQLSPVSKKDGMSEMGSPVKFANPRFFAPRDMSETGLESLFGDTFTLGRDLTVDSTFLGPGQHQAEVKSSAPAPKPFFRLVAAIGLGTSCVTWDYASTVLPALAVQIRLLCLLVAASLSAWNFYASSTSARASGIVVSVISITTATYMGTSLYHPLSAGEETDNLGALGLWYLLAMTVWEIWGFISGLATPSDDEPCVDAPRPETMPPERPQPNLQAYVQAVPQPVEHTRRNAPVSTNTTTVSARTKPNSVVVSQRTTRSKAQKLSKGTRDSLGVGMGSLSLDSW
ncbi:MAG: hypothetical protein Q9218_005406 [Villophora microphyllina]